MDRSRSLLYIVFAIFAAGFLLLAMAPALLLADEPVTDLKENCVTPDT